MKPMKNFDDWFNEQELYGLRSERLYAMLETHQWDVVVKWLKAAYNQGREDERESLCDKPHNSNQETVMIVNLEKDSEGYILPLGEELCNELGWNVGDTIEWKDNGDGSWTISKKKDHPKVTDELNKIEKGTANDD